MFLRFFDERPALIDAGTGATVTYADLSARVADTACLLGPGGGLVFLFADNSVATLVAYLAALAQGHAVALFDPTMAPARAAALIETYQPETVVRDGVERRRRTADPPHSDLAVLLTTSGSTASPKLVRLSRANILANAAAIADSLDLTRADRAMTTLPLHYSYGMSVVNSYLHTGASLVVGAFDPLDQRCWDAVRRHRVTSLAGVPFTYQTLRRVGFASMDLPGVTTLTQAGGKLDDGLTRFFADLMHTRSGRFYVMYGQTEAGPRMTCLPPHRLPATLGSVGLPLAGGRVVVRGEDGEPVGPGVTGTVCYTGPNVMMGYAGERADLALGDVHGDTLDTGDLGYLDDEGYLYITGRTKRIGKLFGIRLSLDEVETMLHAHGPVAAVGTEPDRLTVFCAWGDADRLATERRRLCRELKLPPHAVNLVRLPALPVLPSGKTDYRALTELSAAEPT